MDNLQLDPQLQADLDAVLNRGVKSAYVREDGHLIFVMSDNQEVDLGDIQGPVMEAVKTYIEEHAVTVDDTLTVSGAAADAAAAGARLKLAERNIEGLLQDISHLMETTVPKSGGAMTGDLDMGGNTVTGLGDPADDTDAVPKGYLERRLENFGGTGGEAGGYYTPAVSQPEAGSMEISFDASSGEMPEVAPVLVALPQGEKGDTGPQGEKGDTGPQGEKGADGAPGVAQVPLFADSVEECTDTSKVYVLPDGYLYAYMTTEIEARNLFDPDAATLNARISSSGTPAYNGLFISGYIPIETLTANVDKFYISGVTTSGSAGTGIDPGISNQYCGYYDSNKTLLGRESFATTAGTSNALVEKAEDGSTIFWPLTSANEVAAIIAGNPAYVRFGLAVNGTQTAITAADIADVSIRRNEGTTGEAWGNTGHAFVPADYEDDIIELRRRVAALESGSGSVNVPDYWREAVDEAVEKAAAIQDEGGSDVVGFLLFSDMHHNTGNKYTSNLGVLCAAVMDACNIPLALMCGDTMSADSVSSEDTLLAWLEDAADVLAPIGADRLMQIRGNHDDVYGSHTAGGTTTYYVNKVAPAKIWNRIFRQQAGDFRRVFGGDGTFFYLDNVPQKIRFICLNCQFYDGGGVTDGTSGNMTWGLGTEQLAWLENVALSVGSDWGVVIATHVPPTAQVINDRTDYLSLYGNDGDSFRSILTSSPADIIGIFCGHAHVDAIVTGDLRCPIITITCAANTPYDGTSADRVAGTDTETALDIVLINKTDRTIHTVRLGAGTDREIGY